MTNKIKRIVYTYLRVICGAIILLYGIFRVGIPLINKEPLYMDKNDGYILIGSLILLLCVEVIKASTEAYIKRKSKNIN